MFALHCVLRQQCQFSPTYNFHIYIYIFHDLHTFATKCCCCWYTMALKDELQSKQTFCYQRMKGWKPSEHWVLCPMTRANSQDHNKSIISYNLFWGCIGHIEAHTTPFWWFMSNYIKIVFVVVFYFWGPLYKTMSNHTFLDLLATQNLKIFSQI